MPAQGLDIRDWWRDDLSDLLKERSFMAAAMMYLPGTSGKRGVEEFFKAKGWNLCRFMRSWLKC